MICFSLIGFYGIYISNNLSLILKPISHASSSHLLKMGFSLLLAQLLRQWISYVIRSVNFLHLDVSLLEIIVDEVESSPNVPEFLMSPRLLSLSYGTVVVTEEWDNI